MVAAEALRALAAAYQVATFIEKDQQCIPPIGSAPAKDLDVASGHREEGGARRAWAGATRSAWDSGEAAGRQIDRFGHGPAFPVSEILILIVPNLLTIRVSASWACVIGTADNLR